MSYTIQLDVYKAHEITNSNYFPEVVVCIKERIPKKWTMEKMITYFTKKAKKKKYFLKDRYINKKMKVSTWVLLQNISERTYARKCYGADAIFNMRLVDK